MSKATRIWLIVAASLVLIGCMIVGGVMAMGSWDFSKLSTNKYQINKYEITEGFSDILVVSATAELKVIPSIDGRAYVECYEQENLGYSVLAENGKLSIRLEDTRKWYQHIGINFGECAKLTVYIPEGEYGALEVISSTGEVEISKDFNFKSIDVRTSTGKIVCRASADEGINLKATTGDITVENISSKSLCLLVSTGDVKVTNVTCTEDVKIGVTTGKTSLASVRCENLDTTGSTGDISLNNVIVSKKLAVNRSTGGVRFTDSDAGEILIVTDTGDVRGSLLSDKIFIVNTDTGRKDVPRTTSGGICDVTTDTGDIVITISDK